MMVFVRVPVCFYDMCVYTCVCTSVSVYVLRRGRMMMWDA
jgi:hypothetical protein